MNAEKTLTEIIDKLEKESTPFFIEANKASFEAAVSGAKEDYDRAAEFQLKYARYFSDKETFLTLKSLKESALIEDPLLKRQLDLLYNTFLSKQIPEEQLEDLIRRGAALENRYSAYRATIGEKQMSDNQIDEILSTSLNNEELKEAWIASKNIGSEVEDEVLLLVRKRNEIAKSLGFDNYQQMSLTIDEQDPAETEKLFDELDLLTREAYIEVKNEIDSFLANRLKIKKEELQPWHYQNRFFQEPPVIYDVDLDKYYGKANIEAVATKYYNGMGLVVNDIMDRSDLYEKPGKNQHAFCIDIDQAGDVRMLCNLKPNSYWANTLLHELGHAVYSKYNDPSLPFFLRSHAHIFTTEAIAMLFGRFSTNAQWLQDNLAISEKEKQTISDAAYKNLRAEQLVFSRWSQVLFRFEKAMYENPEQDLNALWWDLVEKYQMIKKPEGRDEPDYATKIHIALYPCYYHNYLMGELLASQLYQHISTSVLQADSTANPSFTDQLAVGEYLKAKIFSPGKKYTWNEMIINATGEPLTAKHYAKQFVE